MTLVPRRRLLGPATGDVATERRLERAGAVVVGKTATSEWAIGDHGPDRPTPRPINPWASDRSPGDSSAGSGVAVAAGLCSIAFGTDTAGSGQAGTLAAAVAALLEPARRRPGARCAGSASTAADPLARGVVRT